MALAGHDLPDVVYIVFQIKGDQILGLHKEADRHTLVDKPGHRIGIIGGGNDGTAVLLGQLPDGKGYGGAFADDDTACIHLDGAELGFIAVSQNDQIVLIDILLHKVRVGGSDEYFSLFKEGIAASHHKSAFQGVDDVGIAGAGLGQNAAVIDIHVGLGDITYGDQSLQHMLFRNDRQGDYIGLLHEIPCFFQGNVVVYALSLPDVDVSDLGLYTFQIQGCLCLKIGQDEFGLRIKMPGPAGDILLSGAAVLVAGIADGGTDRIRIRIPVTDDDGLFLFVVFFRCYR